MHTWYVNISERNPLIKTSQEAKSRFGSLHSFALCIEIFWSWPFINLKLHTEWRFWVLFIILISFIFYREELSLKSIDISFPILVWLWNCILPKISAHLSFTWQTLLIWIGYICSNGSNFVYLAFSGSLCLIHL